MHRAAHVEEVTEDDADAQLQAEEDVEEEEEKQQEIQREIDDALEQQHRQAKEEMMKMFLRSLAEHKQQQDESDGRIISPYANITAGEEEEEEEDFDSQSTPSEDESFLSWLRSSLVPSSAALSAARLSSYARYWSLQAGRLLWNVSTASALLLLPIVLAQMGEEAKVGEANTMMKMEARLDLLERQGAGGLGVGGWGAQAPAGGAAGAAVPINAPAGYVPPAMEMSGIPAAGARY